MSILDTLKAKFAGNQVVLDEIASEEAQAAADAAKQEKEAQAEQGADDIQAVDVDPNRPPASQPCAKPMTQSMG